MSEITTAEVTESTVPAWLLEAQEDMANQQSEFADIEKGLYILELTGYDSMKQDSSGNLGCQLELTIKDDEKFGGRKIWSWAVLEGQWSNILTKKLIVAWIKRNPDKVAYLGVEPTDQASWEEYLTTCKDAGLTAIANVKPKKKTLVEVEAGYKTKYDVYVSADQTADAE